MREYFLYLDESGDFDKDLNKTYRNECLVGGILIPKDKLPKEFEIDNQLIDVWKKCFPEQIKTPRNEILDKLHHATELEINIKVKVISAILPEISTIGKFVIFENYQKSKVINSTLTYANILAEGIIQLLTSLALEDTSSPVKLNVVAGSRRDMIKDKEKAYIEPETLTSRIEERLRLLEIKSQSLSGLGAKYSFELGDDKRNTYLIICDYICHFYFKRDNEIYSFANEKGQTIGQMLLSFYDPNYIFSLQGNAETERVLYGITNESYGNLLFDAATGFIEEKKNVDKIINTFCKLPEETRKIHLSILSNRYKEIIENKRNLDLSDKLMQFADYLDKKMTESGVKDNRFRFEMLLYHLTIANHKGNLKQMDILFEEAKSFLPKLIGYSDNLDLVFMLINRYAVFLYDEFEFEREYSLLNKALQQFEAYELIVEGLVTDVLPKETQEDFEQTIWSNQKARMLGTQLQVATYLVRNGALEYEKAVLIYENAIANFTLQKDLKRIYQVRADLESYCNNIEEAYKYLLLGLDVKGIQLFQVTKDKSFELYHLSVFVNCFADLKNKEVEEAKKVLKNALSMILNSRVYPYFVIAGNAAEAFAKTKESKDMVKKFYLMSFEEDKEELSIIRMLKLMLRCSYIDYLLEIKDSETLEIDEVLRIAKEMLSSDIPDKMKKMLTELIESTDSNKFKLFAQKRQY